MARRPKPTSMADIVAEVRELGVVAPGVPGPVEDPDGQWIDVDGRRFLMSDEELTAAEARDLAAASRFVVWDSCGCGGGCGHTIWRGSAVTALLQAGVLDLEEGWVTQIEDDTGRRGVLCQQAVRWGPLR